MLWAGTKNWPDLTWGKQSGGRIATKGGQGMSVTSTTLKVPSIRAGQEPEDVSFLGFAEKFSQLLVFSQKETLVNSVR
jgi:hypothetical protein